MSNILALSRSDFRSTFRDPVFKGLLFFPLLAFALVRWGFPWISAHYPAIVPYSHVILMWACLQSATMFGFIYGFLFLEEKEEHIWQAIRVLPISGLRLVGSRLLLGVGISTVVNFLLIHFGNIATLPFLKEILLSFQFALAAPLIALWLGAFAANRIEGMAQMKIINMLLILPALMYFFDFKMLHAFAIVPTYWSYRSMENALDGDFWLFFLVGISIHGVAIFLLNRKLEGSMRG